MTAEPSGTPSGAAWSTVTSFLTELRAGHEGLTNFIEQLLDELEAVQNLLENSERQLDGERVEHAQQCRELIHKCQQLETATAALEPDSAHANAEWEQRRAALESELATARQQIGTWQHERSNLINDVETLRQQTIQWQQERSLLENELETVRGRAAEMAQTVSEQKRQMAEDRAEWSGELKHLRRVLERQTESLTQRAQAAQAVAAAVATPVEVSAASNAPDAALGSVMAQFEMLQRDLQRRRQARS